MAEDTACGSLAGNHPKSLECSSLTFDGEGVIHRRSSLIKTPSPKKISVSFNSSVTELRPRHRDQNSQKELDLLEVLERDELLVRSLDDTQPGSRGSISRMRSPEPPAHDDDDEEDYENMIWGKLGPAHINNPFVKEKNK